MIGGKKDSLKVGLVGTGFIGPVHLEALRRINIHVKGVAEATPELSEAKAKELDLAVAYPSFDNMLADPEIDVVHLAVPNYLHYPYAKEALLAGKHVVCEKPLAMNTDQSAELVELAKQTKRVNAVNYNIRFYPMVQQVKSMVQNNELGDLFIIHGSYLQDWLLFQTDWNWRLLSDIGGSPRAVGDIGSHWLDLIHFITGLKVSEVFAVFKTIYPIRKEPTKLLETFTGKMLKPEDYVERKADTEDYATVLLHYENGVPGVVTISQISSGRKNRLSFEINGSESSIAWNSERPNELWIGHRTEPNQVWLKDPALMSNEACSVVSYPGGHNEGFPDTFKQLYMKVYTYILKDDFSKESDFPTFETGHYEMKLIKAIEKSAKLQKWVKVE